MRGKRDRRRKDRTARLQGLPGTLSNMKLLRFHENVRPAYWGTFSKTSLTVRPRRPFATDGNLFDYDLDSDAEWEEEGEGEVLSDSEGEPEKEEEDYDEDEEEGEVYILIMFWDDLVIDENAQDKWVVPDGYLSADEGMDSDDEKSKKAVKQEGEESTDDTGTLLLHRILDHILTLHYQVPQVLNVQLNIQ